MYSSLSYFIDQAFQANDFNLLKTDEKRHEQYKHLPLIPREKEKAVPLVTAWNKDGLPSEVIENDKKKAAEYASAAAAKTVVNNFPLHPPTHPLTHSLLSRLSLN